MRCLTTVSACLLACVSLPGPAQEPGPSGAQQFVDAMEAYVSWQEALPDNPGLTGAAANAAWRTLNGQVLQSFSNVDVGEPVWSLCALQNAGLSLRQLVYLDSNQHLDHAALNQAALDLFAEADRIIANANPVQLCVSADRREYPPPTDANAIRDELDTLCRVFTGIEVTGFEGLSERQKLVAMLARAGNMSAPVSTIFASMERVAVERRYGMIQRGAQDAGVSDWHCQYLEDSRFPWFADSEELTLASAAPSTMLAQASAPDSPLIALTSRAVLVNDEHILSLQEGLIPEGQRVSSSSPIVPDLRQAVQEDLTIRARWAVLRDEEAPTDFVWSVHASTPYATVVQALFTSSAAGSDTARFVLRTADGSWTERELSISSGTDDSGSTGPWVAVHLSAAGFRLHLRAGALPGWGPVSEALSQREESCAIEGITLCDPTGYYRLYERLAALHDREQIEGIVISADADVPWGDVVTVMETVRWWRGSGFESNQAMWDAPLDSSPDFFTNHRLALPPVD